MTVPSLLVFGADAVLAATPATAIQLMHACHAAGFHSVIPATWGDELIAAHTLDRLREKDLPLVPVSCPLVTRRLATHGTPIGSMLLPLISPPVATAAYLRALYAPLRPNITFAGGCARVGDDVIDNWISADELLSELADRGIELAAQPTEFDSVLPPDRRRFYSQPGGIPTRAALRLLAEPVDLRELSPDDFVLEVGQFLLSKTRLLLDVAPALGCRCAGMSENTTPSLARSRIMEVEPPRSFTPIVDHSVAITLDAPPPVGSAEPSVPRAFPVGAPEVPPATPPMRQDEPPVVQSMEMLAEPAPLSVETLSRRTPPGQPRPVLGTMPQTRTDAGRQLPRAYVARRRSSPRNVRQIQPPVEAGAPRNQLRWIAVAATGLAAGLLIAWLAFIR